MWIKGFQWDLHGHLVQIPQNIDEEKEDKRGQGVFLMALGLTMGLRR